MVRLSVAMTSPEVTEPVSESPAIEALTLPPPMHPPGERIVPETAEPVCTRSALTEIVWPSAVALPDHFPLRSDAGLADDVEVTEPPEFPEQPAMRSKAKKKQRMIVCGGARARL